MRWTKEDRQRSCVWAFEGFIATYTRLKEIAEENEVDNTELWECWKEQKEARS